MLPGAKAKSRKAAGEPLGNLSSMEKELGASILGSLVCPVPQCNYYLYTPIRQCKAGHSLCVGCLKSNSQNCPVCKKPIVQVRNVALEDISSKLLVPCKNREIGCPEVVLKTCNNFKLHELQCAYRPYSCFALKCSWKGCSTDLCLHMAESHSERVFTSEEKLFKIKKMDSREDIDLMALMVTTFGSFWAKIVFQKAVGMFLGAVQYVGPSKLAEKCRYRFEITAEEKGTEKCLTYSRCTHKDTIDFDLIFQSRDCLCVPLQFAQYLSTGNILQIKLNIEQVKPN